MALLSGYPSFATSLKNEKTASGSCVRGELMGIIERDESMGELYR